VFNFNKIFFVLSVKFLKLYFCVENFSFPKKDINFFETKSSLSHHITKEKRIKQKIPIPFLQPPHPTPPKE
jgi:hypothetical protein